MRSRERDLRNGHKIHKIREIHKIHEIHQIHQIHKIHQIHEIHKILQPPPELTGEFHFVSGSLVQEPRSTEHCTDIPGLESPKNCPGSGQALPSAADRALTHTITVTKIITLT